MAGGFSEVVGQGGSVTKSIGKVKRGQKRFDLGKKSGKTRLLSTIDPSYGKTEKGGKRKKE